ncbi:MAG: hypothetical protein AB4426_31590 [Xenococcaceae cyanobacterium]
MTEVRADYKTRFRPIGAQPLAKHITAVRLPVDIDAQVRLIPSPQRSAWLRRVIGEAVHRELMEQKPKWHSNTEDPANTRSPDH